MVCITVRNRQEEPGLHVGEEQVFKAKSEGNVTGGVSFVTLLSL